MNTIKSKVMTIANKLVGKGYNRLMAMIKAWILAKAQGLNIRVSGVTFDDRQEVLQYISKCNPAHIKRQWADK